MTSSSSPGVSLKQEGVSYLCGADLPCLIVNIMRGGRALAPYSPASRIISSQPKAVDMVIIT